MGSHADRTDSPTATTEAPAGPDPAPPVPPAAQRLPRERAHHGDTVVDEYAWLAGKDNPDVVAYLEAENAYTAAMTARPRRHLPRICVMIMPVLGDFRDANPG